MADCFHRLRLGGENRKYFCWPGVKARYLGVTTVEGRQIDGEQRVWPMHSSLPMRFSWSLYFAQRANVARLARQPRLQGVGVGRTADRPGAAVRDGRHRRLYGLLHVC